MMNPQFIEKFVTEFEKALPDNVKAMNEEVRQQTRQMAEKVIGSLNLVTREEFDAQCKVLAKTREKVELLEQKLSVLEAQLNDKNVKETASSSD
ncbi:MAG: accessory factor UbiK family protein [Pseudomonadota bacterium]